MVVLLFLAVAAGFLLTWYIYPKNAGRYPFFLLLVALDYYLWTKVKKRVFTYHKWLKRSFSATYWSSLFALVAAMLLMLILPQNQWNQHVRIYFFGLLFAIYVAKIIPAIILLSYELVSQLKKLFNYLMRQIKNESTPKNGTQLTRRKFIENTSFAAGGVIIGSMILGIFKWAHDFKIHKQTVFIPTLPDEFTDYKLVQISDMHLGSWADDSPLVEAVEKINSFEPDLVVFTGDLVNYRTDEAYRFKEILGQIKAKDGVCAILGNHDYGDYVNWPSKEEKQRNLEDLVAFYHQLGWKLLRNENILITRNTGQIALIGVENWSKNNRFPRYGNIVKASKGIGRVSAKILLSHDPSHWNSVVTEKHHDIDLMLAGHTHGFQFGIEIPGIRWSPAQYLYEQWAGWYQHPATQQQLYVNRGLGSIGYPGRIGILPEITLLVLNNKQYET